MWVSLLGAQTNGHVQQADGVRNETVIVQEASSVRMCMRWVRMKVQHQRKWRPRRKTYGIPSETKRRETKRGVREVRREPASRRCGQGEPRAADWCPRQATQAAGVCMRAKSLQQCWTPCDPVDCSP